MGPRNSQRFSALWLKLDPCTTPSTQGCLHLSSQTHLSACPQAGSSSQLPLLLSFLSFSGLASPRSLSVPLSSHFLSCVCGCLRASHYHQHRIRPWSRCNGHAEWASIFSLGLFSGSSQKWTGWLWLKSPTGTENKGFSESCPITSIAIELRSGCLLLKIKTWAANIGRNGKPCF